MLASHTSNLKLGCGVSPLPDLMRAGAVIGVGTDGAASNNSLDVLKEARLAALVHKGVRRDATTVTAVEALEMATWGGAAAIGIERLGRLQPGWRADLACFDLTAPHLCPGTNVYSDLVYAAQAADVTDVVIDGQLVLQDRHFPDLDVAAVLAHVRERAARLRSLV